MMNYNDYGGYDPYTYGQPYMQTMATPAAAQQTQMNAIFVYPQNLQGALVLIQQALSGETEDRMFYTWLMGQAPSKEDQQIISGIRGNEIGHYALFRQLYYELTGSMAPQVQSEPFTPPAHYCEGLARALLGEQMRCRATAESCTPCRIVSTSTCLRRSLRMKSGMEFCIVICIPRTGAEDKNLKSVKWRNWGGRIA